MTYTFKRQIFLPPREGETPNANRAAPEINITLFWRQLFWGALCFHVNQILSPTHALSKEYSTSQDVFSAPGNNPEYPGHLVQEIVLTSPHHLLSFLSLSVHFCGQCGEFFVLVLGTMIRSVNTESSLPGCPVGLPRQVDTLPLTFLFFSVSGTTPQHLHQTMPASLESNQSL